MLYLNVLTKVIRQEKYSHKDWKGGNKTIIVYKENLSVDSFEFIICMEKSGYKKSISNLIVCLYTSSNQMENVVKKKTPFTTLSEILKKLRINLTKICKTSIKNKNKTTL